jgi:BolA protein
MSRPRQRTDDIRARLERELDAELVEVTDDSARHAGHAGASEGGGHYRVCVVSARFAGLSRVAAQRLVYEALGSLMRDAIHALEMRTLTPEQWRRGG